MFCPRCGKPVTGAPQFCVHCGTALNSSKERASDAPAAADVPVSTLFVADVDAMPSSNAYAWGLVLVLGLGLAVRAFVPEQSSTNTMFVFSVVVLGLVSGFFVYRDMLSNNIELNPFRFAVGFVLPLVWLWMRGRAGAGSRAPFWCYVFVLAGGLTALGFVRLPQSALAPVSAVSTAPLAANGTPPDSPKPSAVVPVAADAVAAAQPPGDVATGFDASAWRLSFETDAMTDRRTLHAVALASPSETSPYVYQLTAKCDGERKDFSLATFDKGQGRPIPFEFTVLPDSAALVRRFRYRFDDNPQMSGELKQTDFTNGAHLPLNVLYSISSTQFTKEHALLGQTMQQVQTAMLAAPSDMVPRDSASTGDGTWAFGRLPTEFASCWTGSCTPKVSIVFRERIATEVVENQLVVLPRRRLLLADVFPGETVEFAFSALSDADRTTLTNMCFPSAAKQ